MKLSKTNFTRLVNTGLFIFCAYSIHYFLNYTIDIINNNEVYAQLFNFLGENNTSTFNADKIL
ncbi:hypothetical protein BH18THE2_BH18THE2_40040 [soil metagenome]